MRNAGAPGYEGPANLLDAFRVAASADSRGKGVLVVLNDEINSAREVTKTDALRVQTFQSRPYGILGVVDPDRVVYYREPLKRHTQKTEFDVSSDHVAAARRHHDVLPGRVERSAARGRRCRRQGHRHRGRRRRPDGRFAGARASPTPSGRASSSSRRPGRAAAALRRSRRTACAKA